MTKHILIVDDESSVTRSLEQFFELKGFRVSVAHDAQTGIETARSTDIDIVLLDLRLPDMDGMEALNQIKQACPSTGVVIFTGYGDVETAVRAMQQKADNFLLKPVDLKVLEVVINQILYNYQRQNETPFMENQELPFVGLHKGRRLILPHDVAHGVRLLADNSAINVLIMGDTGTGKGLVAQAIHSLSDRHSHQLVEINCAGLSDSLLESELFGHERGAFTDAKSSKRGLLEVAHGGSLFLDEVSELSPAVQAKLLKVLEDQTFRRVGGTTSIKVDVRILAATNSDLEQAVEARRFRSDLYFRLSVMPVRLPPLRERRQDIPLLSSSFITEFNQVFGRNVTSCSPGAESMLLYYSWPGNIRELRNVIERAVLLCQGNAIMPAHLPDNLRTKSRPKRLNKLDDCSLKAVEAKHIQRVLDACDNNRSRAASMLGIHRATLINKIKKYCLSS